MARYLPQEIEPDVGGKICSTRPSSVLLCPRVREAGRCRAQRPS